MTEEEKLKALGELHLRCMDMERRCQDVERIARELEEKVKRLRRLSRYMLLAMQAGLASLVLLLGAVIVFIVK